MNKFISIFLSTLIGLLLIGCTSTTIIDANSKSPESLIKETVSKYYLSINPQNNGELKIYSTKQFDDKYLVLSEKYSGDGHRFTTLLLIDDKYNVLAWTSGETPISMCFSINKVYYDDILILFGNFNNSKWDSNQDKKIPVQINKIDIKFTDNKTIKENVSMENGFIILSNSIADIEQFNLYNEKNELQSNLEELGNISETQFKEF